MNSVLFVDDEIQILNSLKRGLMEEPYTRYFATSGKDALVMLEEHDISVLVTDMRMPGMTGLDLLKAAKDKYPEMVKLVLSGYTQLPQVLVTVNQGDIFKFITKPWELDEFKVIIQEAVDFYNYRAEMTKARSTLEKKNITFQNILKTYDDKVLSMRDETGFMRDMVRKWMHQVTRSVIQWNPQEESKERIVEDILHTQAMVMEGFALIPFQTRRISAKQIQEHIRRLLIDRKAVMQVEFRENGTLPLTIKGRCDLFLFFFQNILTWSFMNVPETRVMVTVSGEPQHENHVKLKVVMAAESRFFLEGTVPGKARSWIFEWAERFDSELQIKDLGELKAVVLCMMFES